MFGFTPKFFEVTKSEMVSMLPREIADHGKYDFKRDTHYNIPLDPAYIVKKCPAKKYIYDSKNPELMDCDKRVYIYRGWIAGLYLKSFGMEAILKPGHDTIAFFDIKSGKKEHGKYGLIFADFQTGKMMPEHEVSKYKVEMLIA